ncbi:hypothetical protein ACTAQI_05555 [Pseudarthrobacter sp. alpha12b]
MPKISRTTASSHQVLPGYVDAYEHELAGWTVSIEKNFIDMDQAPFFKGAPNDQCQAHHMGYVLKGKFGVRLADGTEEIFEAGDSFVIEPGHTPLAFAGSEYVAFTPAEEAKRQTELMMPNIIKFAQEQGLNLPAQQEAQPIQ